MTSNNGELSSSCLYMLLRKIQTARRKLTDFVVLIQPRYAPSQFVKLSQRLDRAELIDVERGEGFERCPHASVRRSGFRFRLRVRRAVVIVRQFRACWQL